MLAEIVNYQSVACSDIQASVSAFKLWPSVNQHASSDMATDELPRDSEKNVSFLSVIQLFIYSEIGMWRVSIKFCSYGADVTLFIMSFSLTSTIAN